MSEGAAKKEEKPRKFQAIRGTRDLLPPETALWNRVEQTAHEVFATFGFGEIRLPIFEQTELFARSIGADTDVVSKEMYTFEDHDLHDLNLRRSRSITDIELFTEPTNVGIILPYAKHFLTEAKQELTAGKLPRTPSNEFLLARIESDLEYLATVTDATPRDAFRDRRSELRRNMQALELGPVISLRPEVTASVCRAYIEHNMQQLPQPVKLYCIGPMFRRERPQKGRYRQFYQIDAEVLGGTDAPAIDAEVIEMVMTFFERLGLEGVQLHINSIGDKKCRPKYVELLRAELSKVKDRLGADSQRRIETNPLRVLDSKLESEQKLIERMPHIADHLCEECAENYRGVKKELELRGVKYRENWRLVRGLDYYMRTTFEITAKGLGSQNAVCGGGRYDGLVELLGGPPTKGIGFAIGEDRLILSLQESARAHPGDSGSPLATRHSPLLYIAWMGEKAYTTAIRAAKNLRNAGFRVELPPLEQKFGKALGQADKLGARFALILGDNEVTSGQWTLKTLADGKQEKLRESDLVEHLKKQL